MPVVGTYQSASHGLVGEFSYNNVLGPLVRYTHADGYLALVSPGTHAYTLRLLNGVATSTSMVMAPGVSIIEPRPFSPSASEAAQTVEVVLPAGYVYTEVIAKTARADGKTPFYVDVTAPVSASGPVDAAVWFRPTK